MKQIDEFLTTAALALNNATPNESITQTTIDGWRSNLSTARTNIQTARSNLTSAEEKLKGKKSDLLIAEEKLALTLAGSSLEEINAQEAAVRKAQANISSQESKIRQAEARIASIKTKIAKTILRSPISGTITEIDTDIGETVTANESVVTVESTDNLMIEVYIPEVDIAEIAVGKPADITLDAYGDEVVFKAYVYSIYPSETIIEGVPTYKAILQFEQPDERIMPGMTANIDILVDKKENVLYVPQRTVIKKKQQEMVQILSEQSKIKEVLVKTGLRGSDGTVEILEGLKEGDKVIIHSGK